MIHQRLQKDIRSAGRCPIHISRTFISESVQSRLRHVPYEQHESCQSNRWNSSKMFACHAAASGGLAQRPCGAWRDPGHRQWPGAAGQAAYGQRDNIGPQSLPIW
eukprot:scaffold664481_cov48-Prasinocladus_malaysianus.AAC.1